MSDYLEISRAKISQSQGLTQMSAEWLTWVDRNISRGCTAQSIIDTLVQSNYNKDFATKLVLERLANPADPTVDFQRYDYEEIGIKLSGHVVQTHDRDINVLLTVDKPRIILFGNVLSHDECEQMIELSKPKMNKSTTVNNATGATELHKNRTSYGAFFQINETPFIANIDRRTSELMQLPIANGEGLQILNYRIGGEYKPHHDYFPPQETGSRVHVARGGQRVATLILYLNNVEDGGETIFPEINLKVAPKQGNALYFAYTNSKSQVDPLTLHGGCPVLKGEKWIATKWMRQNEYR